VELLLGEKSLRVRKQTAILRFKHVKVNTDERERERESDRGREISRGVVFCTEGVS